MARTASPTLHRDPPQILYSVVVLLKVDVVGSSSQQLSSICFLGATHQARIWTSHSWSYEREIEEEWSGEKVDSASQELFIPRGHISPKCQRYDHETVWRKRPTDVDPHMTSRKTMRSRRIVNIAEDLSHEWQRWPSKFSWSLYLSVL